MPPRARDSETTLAARGDNLDAALAACQSRWLQETRDRLIVIAQQWPMDRPLEDWIRDGEKIDSALRGRPTASDDDTRERGRVIRGPRTLSRHGQ